MIKNGDHHVSLDTVTNKLFLSKIDPRVTIYKHFDGKLKNQNGNKCLGPKWNGDLYFSDSKFPFAKHDQLTRTFA